MALPLAGRFTLKDALLRLVGPEGFSFMVRGESSYEVIYVLEDLIIEVLSR